MEVSSRASLEEARERLDELTGAGTFGEPDTLRQASENLFSFADLLGNEIGLRRALADPGLPASVRTGLLDRLVGDQIGALALEVLRTVVSSRWSRPADLITATDELGAEALLASEQVSGGLDEVEDELFRFARIIDRTPRLSLALSDKGLPADRKTALLDRLLDGRVSPATRRLVERVVSSPRGRGVGRELEVLAELASSRRQRSIAVVTVARPLDAEQAERLRVAIARAFGTEVVLQVVIDPAIVGGVSVRVGDEVVDGTVLRRLAEARRQLRR